MKNKNMFLALLISCSLVIACKKKDKTTESEPAPSTTTTTPAHVNSFTATVNGQNWSTVSYTGYRAGYSWGMSGQSAVNNPYTYIGSTFTYTTGTFTLTKYGLFNMRYIDQSNTIYSSSNGTITISEIDSTATGGLKKIKASFAFHTDTVNGQSFNVTQGAIDYIKP